jgi:hypothetical protein
MSTVDVGFTLAVEDPTAIDPTRGEKTRINTTPERRRARPAAHSRRRGAVVRTLADLVRGAAATPTCGRPRRDRSAGRSRGLLRGVEYVVAGETRRFDQSNASDGELYQPGAQPALRRHAGACPFAFRRSRAT